MPATATVCIYSIQSSSVFTLYLLIPCVYKQRSMRDWWKMCCVQVRGYILVSKPAHVTLADESTRENSLKHVVYTTKYHSMQSSDALIGLATAKNHSLTHGTQPHLHSRLSGKSTCWIESMNAWIFHSSASSTHKGCSKSTHKTQCGCDRE